MIPPAVFARRALARLRQQLGDDDLLTISLELIEAMSTLDHGKFIAFELAVQLAKDIDGIVAAINTELEPSFMERNLQVMTAKQQPREPGSAFAIRIRLAAVEDDGHDLDNRYVISAISGNLQPAYRDVLRDKFPDAEFRLFSAFADALRAVDRMTGLQDQQPSSCPRHPWGNHSAAECRASKGAAAKRVKCRQCGKFGHYKSSCATRARATQHARQPIGSSDDQMPSECDMEIVRQTASKRAGNDAPVPKPNAKGPFTIASVRYA